MDTLPLMSTNSLLSPEQIISLYIDRWNLEVTFEESREHLGIETQRQWSDLAIARATPILFGLYSLVWMIGNQLDQSGQLRVHQTAWYLKKYPTLSDVLRAVRMGIWRDNLIFRKAKTSASGENITPEMREWAEELVKQLLEAA